MSENPVDESQWGLSDAIDIVGCDCSGCSTTCNGIYSSESV